MDEAKNYLDLLLPIEILNTVGFNGPSSRGNIGLNGEVGFKIEGYQCSFHNINKKNYIIVRLKCLQNEAKEKLEWVRGKINSAAAWLDISIRTVGLDFEISSNGNLVQLTKACFFPAGNNPRIVIGEASFSIGVSAEHLTIAFQDHDVHESFDDSIFDLFNDVDFESTLTSQFVIMTTILEMMARREQRDVNTMKLIDEWVAHASELNDESLAGAVSGLKYESTASAIANCVSKSASEAGCDDVERTNLMRRAKALYARRSAILHHGKKVKRSELIEIRKLVRLIFFRQVSDGVFSKAPRY